MKKAWPWIVTALTSLVAVLSFAATNSPKDVENNARGWLAAPIIRDLPGWLMQVIASPITLSLAFFVLGAVFGRWTTVRLAARDTSTAAQRLGYEVYMVAAALDNTSRVYPNAAVISSLNVTMNRLARAGYPMPPQEGDGFNRDFMSMYLHQVSAYLREDDEGAARNAAKTIAEQWREQQHRGALPF